MAEYIERESAIAKSFRYLLLNGEESPPVVFTSAIKSIPAADVRPVVRGKWIRPHWKNAVHCFDCSECNSEAQHATYNGVKKYYHICPNCGSDMRGE